MEPSCAECGRRADAFFCAMPNEVIRRFDAIKAQTVLAKGTVLFEEGQNSRGAFLLCNGRARLSICSENGKRMMLRVASAGEMVGLGATLSGDAYEFTAELLDASQVVFVKRKEFLEFLRENPAVCMDVVRRLSMDLHSAYERVRAVGLGRARGARAPRAGSMAC